MHLIRDRRDRTSAIVHVKSVPIKLAKLRTSMLPIIYSDSTGLLRHANGFIVYQAGFAGVTEQSLATEAGHLQSFLGYLLRKRRSVKGVDDDFLRDWIACQTANQVTPNVIADRLYIVSAFYKYLERYGWTKGAIYVPGVNDNEDLSFRISTEKYEWYDRNGHSHKDGQRCTVRVQRKSSRPQDTPSDSQIDAIYSTLGMRGGIHVSRNVVMTDWICQAVPRRRELLDMKTRDLPKKSTVLKCMLEGTPCKMKFLDMKGGASREVPVSANLILDTLEYVKNSRTETIKRFRAKPNYKVPKEVFLSERTGKRLANGSFSNLYGKVMDEAGADGHPHRLRAYGIARQCRSFILSELRQLGQGASVNDIDQKALLIRLCAFTGHRSLESVMPYLNTAINEILRELPNGEWVPLSHEVAAMQRKLIALKANLESAKAELAALSKAKRTAGKSPVGRKVRQ